MPSQAVQLGSLTLGEPLQCGQGLSSVPLLNTDMDVIRLRADVLVSSKVTLVCKGICSPLSQFPDE
jgi:hypothetical protein